MPQSREPVPFELRLDASAALHLRGADGGDPLSGVRCTPVDRFGQDVGRPAVTASDGIARLLHLTPGPYRIRLEHPERTKALVAWGESLPQPIR